MPFENFQDGRRNKLVHQQGAVAKVEFVPEGNNPFTGIFRGSQHAIIRLSDADLFAHGTTRPNGEPFV